MKQKYVISKDDEKKEILIKEYAELDKEDLYLICEERLNSDIVSAAIPHGTQQLMSAIRTPNMYQPGIYAEKIAEAIRDMFEPNANQTAELIFDDLQTIKTERIKQIERLDLAEIDQEPSELDEFLDEELEEEFEDDTPIANVNSPLRIADDDTLDIDEEG